MMTSTPATARTLQRLVLLLVALAAALSLVLATPAGATEAEPAGSEDPSAAPTDAATTPADEGATTPAVEGEGGDGEAETGGKLTISSNPHDQFGLILFALGGLAGLAALANAANQLKGKRPAADGRIRWR